MRVLKKSIFIIFIINLYGCFNIKDQAGNGAKPSLPISEKPASPNAVAQNLNRQAIANLIAEEQCTFNPSTYAQLDTTAGGNLWDRITSGFSLSYQQHKRIYSQLKWYSRHPDYLHRVGKRAEPYLYHIVENIEARGMPLELALLPIVESAFDPFAYSHSRASGMWQIIPGTGKMLGLKQSWWYDGRRDVVASTDAALNYLESLHKRFDGDWLLALAAYNSGAGNVSKAIRRNKQRGLKTDFWSLNLPRETKAYVPRLLALSQLVKSPKAYEILFPQIANTPHFEAVHIGSQIDLAQAAELADITMEELYLLNPGFNRWATDPKGPHDLLVPIAKADSFRQKIASIPADQRITWERYRIRSGDSLSTIAAKYHTSVLSLRRINGLKSNRIRENDTLMIPVPTRGKEEYAYSADQRIKKSIARQVARTRGKKSFSYSVQAGDSLWGIAQRYGVSSSKIARWNGISPGDPIQPGQRLTIWRAQSAAVVDQPKMSKGVVRKVAYKVRRGDSLSRIASKFKLSVQDILKWNRLSGEKYLQPGQSLTLFVDVTQTI